MIVVEGPDGAGKSTLVKQLSDKYHLGVGERGVGNRDRLYEVTRRDTYTALSKAVKAELRPLIWDRLWISEYVYHSIQPGRPCEFNLSETDFVHRVVEALHCPFIVCLPPYETVYHNVRDVHQMVGVKESLSQIYNSYRDGELPWPANTLWYDYTGETEDFAGLAEVDEEISAYMQERKHRQAWDL